MYIARNKWAITQGLEILVKQKFPSQYYSNCGYCDIRALTAMLSGDGQHCMGYMGNYH